MPHVVRKYLSHLGDLHRTGGGVAETTYYGALENLLNEIGQNLKPKIHCVSQLKNLGVGAPDFGLFTKVQSRQVDKTKPLDTIPDRGVIEVKGFSDNSSTTAKGKQVAKYLKRYGLVLVTNYREFILVKRTDDGKTEQLESFTIANSETDFLEIISHPQKYSTDNCNRLV